MTVPDAIRKATAALAYGCALLVATSGRAAPDPSPAAGGAAAVPADRSATLRGAVRLAGKAPERTRLQADHDREVCASHEIFSEDLLASPDGGIQDAVVWLEGVPDGKAWPRAEVVLDQERCVYKPHVVVAGAGRPIRFVNSDPVIHNVNTFPRENPPVNLSLLPKGKGRAVTRKFKVPDEVKVICDAHKWMSAWIVVRDNPYFSLTDAKGEYVIDRVPPGKYIAVFWHERLGRLKREVELAAGQTRAEDVQMTSPRPR